MFRLCAFLVKRDDMTAEEFRDYYENHHVPLIEKYSGDCLPPVYKRKYPQKTDKGIHYAGDDAQELPFDVMTEMVFESKVGYYRWGKQMAKDGGTEKVREDELNFSQPSKGRAHYYDEYASTTEE